MAKILQPCGATGGEWQDGGAVSFSGLIISHDNWKIAGQAPKFSTIATPTLKRGGNEWQIFVKAVSPTSVTTIGYSPGLSGPPGFPGTVPIPGTPPAPSTADIDISVYSASEYPEYYPPSGGDIGTAQRNGAVGRPWFANFGNTFQGQAFGYISGDITYDEAANAYQTFTAVSNPAQFPEALWTKTCVANLEKQSTRCCLFTGFNCVYSAWDLANAGGSGITQTSTRIWPFRITQHGLTEDGNDAAWYQAAGIPQYIQYEFSGYLGDPPP